MSYQLACLNRYRMERLLSHLWITPPNIEARQTKTNRQLGVKLPSGAAFDNKFTLNLTQMDKTGTKFIKIMLKHDNLLHQTKHFLNILSHHNEPYLVMRTVFGLKVR